MGIIILYGVLGLVALFLLRVIWLARQDQAYSIFALQRENARRDLIAATMGLIAVLVLIGATYYFNRTLGAPLETPPPPPTVVTRVAVIQPTATMPPATATPTVTPSPTTTPTTLPTQTPSPTATPTSTATPTAVVIPPTPTPDTSAGLLPNCPNPRSRITQPGLGARVDGIIEIRGSASIEAFDYYKFELRFPDVEIWNYVQHYTRPVTEGVLGTWNSDTVPPGEYEFRLVVVDFTGNYPEPCVTRLIVE